MSRHAARSRPGLLAPGGPGRLCVLVLLGYAVLGALAGVVWEWWWKPPGQVISDHQLFYDSYASLRRVFTGSGMYVVVGAVGSALGALATCLLARGRELVVLLLVVIGSVVAAAVMWRVGTLLGPADPALRAAHAAARTRVPGQLAVAGKSPYLVWPAVSLFVLALVYFATQGPLPERHRPDTSPDLPLEADTSESQR